jgi:hypothetical protein
LRIPNLLDLNIPGANRRNRWTSFWGDDQSVQSNGGRSLLVKFKFDDAPMGIYVPRLDENSSAARPLAEVRKEIIDSFWARLKGGSMIAFGSVYEHSIPPQMAEETLRAIENLERANDLA